MANVKTLNDFYSELKNVGVRLKNQFQMTVVSGIREVDDVLQKLIMYVETTTVPGREQKVVEVPYMGYPFQIPTSMAMTQEIELTIRSDANLEIRNAFLRWASAISDPDILGGSNGQGDKRIPSGSTMRLIMMDSKFENTVCTYLLHGCFVKNVGTIEMSNSDAGVATFTATVQYQFWKLEGVNSGNVGGVV